MCKIRRILNRFGKSMKKTVAEKAVLADKRTLSKKNVAEPVYKPVINRPGVISNGEFVYEVEIEDLFSDGKEGLDYQELHGDFQVVANLGRHILDTGGLITGIYIGGGSTEISHTGALAYDKSYSTLEAFVENSMEDMVTAESEAEKEYGIWFTGLDYKFIDINAKIKGIDIKVTVSWFTSSIIVRFRLEKGSEGFYYLTDLVSRFGAEDFHKGVGADKLYWNPTQRIFQRTYQLEETGTVFLTSYMNEEGIFTKYILDVGTADDVYSEILPEKMEQLTRILNEEINQTYLNNPAVSCAEYLQRHNVQDLIALLSKI